MTVFTFQENDKLIDIWANSNAFISDLGTIAPPYFANEYLINPEIKAISEYLYDSIALKYENNMIIGDTDAFKINFIFRFADTIPAYYNSLNGDFSKVENINNIGDTTFYGEQKTTTTDDPFKTPEQSGKYQFKQKTGQELINELKTRSGMMQEILNSFMDLFQRRF